MLTFDIPGYKLMHLEHLVLDYNGTIALDGKLIEGVSTRLLELSKVLSIHVITADTFGTVESCVKNLPCRIIVLGKTDQDLGKRNFIRKLGSNRTTCIGNGRNDRLMLQEAALGIAMIEGEGSAMTALTAADVVCTGILSALDLLLNPLRLTATLRS